MEDSMFLLVIVGGVILLLFVALRLLGIGIYIVPSQYFMAAF